MAIQEAPPQAPVQAQAACPNCSAPAQPGQLVCLECGARLGLRYRKPSPWRRLPAAGLGALALIAAAGFGFALREITSDDEVERASSPAPAQPEPSDAAPPPQRAEREERPRPQQERPAPRRGGVRGWPPGKDAYTVVLLSAGDEASARARARALLETGVPAGVLRSALYPSLSPGFWQVFAGVFDSQQRADREAARYGKRFKGAFPQFVNGSKKRSAPGAAPSPQGSSTAPSSGSP